MKARSANWIKGWLLPGAVIAMESAWLYLWAQVIAIWHGTGPSALLPYPLVLGSMALAFFSDVWIQDRHWSAGQKRWVGVGAAVVFAIVAVRIAYHGLGGLLSTELPATLASYVRGIVQRPSMELIAMVGIGVAWWRGVRCTDPALDDPEVNRLFRIGLVGTGFAILLTTSALVVNGKVAQPEPLLAPAFAFFVFGLVALSAAHMAEIRSGALAAGTGGFGAGRFWLALLAGAAALVVLPGLLIAELVNPGALGALWRPLTLLWDGIANLILLLVYPLAFLVEIVYFLIQLIATHEMPTQPQEAYDEQQENLRELLKNARGEPSPWLTVIEIVFVVVMVAGMVWLLAKLISRRHVREVEEGAISEEHESVFAWDLLLAQIRGMLGSILRRLRGYRPPLVGRREEAPAAEIQAGNTLLSVRQIYTALLRQVAAWGLSRRVYQTPYEYLGDLRTAFPLEGPEMGELTEAYVKVRYGEQPLEPDELARLRETWQRVQSGIAQEIATPKPGGDEAP